MGNDIDMMYHKEIEGRMKFIPVIYVFIKTLWLNYNPKIEYIYKGKR